MHPRVGIGALLVCPAGRVLVGVRRGVAGAGTLALPGGHLELGESLAAAAARETEEETGIVIQPANWTAVAVENIVVASDGGLSPGTTPRPPPDAVASHYVTVFMRASVSDAPLPAAINREPHKCDGWAWRPWGDLRTPAAGAPPLFGPLAALVARCDDVRELTGM
jgi:8-oxo-dGTP diphosphatase